MRLLRFASACVLMLSFGIVGCCAPQKVAARSLESAIQQAAIAAHAGSGGTATDLAIEVHVVTTAAVKGGGDVGAVALEGSGSQSLGTKLTVKVDPSKVVQALAADPQPSAAARFLFNPESQMLEPN